MPELNLAIIGAGNMGRHHARIYNEMPAANLIAICDTNKSKAGDLAYKYDCAYYIDCLEMLRQSRIDAVSIAVPTHMHTSVALQMMEMGLHVLLEKPIASSLAEAKEIIEKAREKNIKLMIGHVERFNPAVRRMKELISDGRLGEIISINIKRVGGLPPQMKDANVIIDLGIHDIDICNYLLGEQPKKAYGIKSKNVVDAQEDSAVVLLEYAKASSFIEVNWITPVKIRTMDITGTKAFARLDYIKQEIILYENSYINQGPDTYDSFEEFISRFSLTDVINIGVNKAEPLRCELESFLHCIMNDDEPLVNGEDAYKSLEIALRI